MMRGEGKRMRGEGKSAKLELSGNGRGSETNGSMRGSDGRKGGKQRNEAAIAMGHCVCVFKFIGLM